MLNVKNIDFNNFVSKLQLPEGETRFEKVKTFAQQALHTAKNKLLEFCTGVYQNAESISVLVLSSLGLSALIGELPFWLTLPWWIEAPLVVPVLSVLTIYLLVYNGERRMLKRSSRA
jgi:hypothetical protein